MDIFYPRATQKDIAELASIINGVNSLYVTELLYMLSDPTISQSPVSLNSNERGHITIPLREYIANMASHVISRVDDRKGEATKN